MIGNEARPEQKLITAIGLNASKPERAPNCAPFTAPKSSRQDPTRRTDARCGAAKVCSASHGPTSHSNPTIRNPEHQATRLERAMIRPALAGSRARSSATYLAAVIPDPSPANAPNVPNVL